MYPTVNRIFHISVRINCNRISEDIGMLCRGDVRESGILSCTAYSVPGVLQNGKGHLALLCVRIRFLSTLRTAGRTDGRTTLSVSQGQGRHCVTADVQSDPQQTSQVWAGRKVPSLGEATKALMALYSSVLLPPDPLPLLVLVVSLYFPPSF
jgi:hypothetical protein